MAVTYGQVSCPSNANTPIIAAANANTVYQGKHFPRTIQLINLSAWDCYLGGDTSLSTANGYLLKANASITIQLLGAGDAIYGRAASNTAVISYLCTGS